MFRKSLVSWMLGVAVVGGGVAKSDDGPVFHPRHAASGRLGVNPGTFRDLRGKVAYPTPDQPGGGSPSDPKGEYHGNPPFGPIDPVGPVSRRVAPGAWGRGPVQGSGTKAGALKRDGSRPAEGFFPTRPLGGKFDGRGAMPFGKFAGPGQGWAEDGDGGRPDGGRPAGGHTDGGRPDGGRPDGGRPDGGRPDGGSGSGSGRPDNDPRDRYPFPGYEAFPVHPAPHPDDHHGALSGFKGAGRFGASRRVSGLDRGKSRYTEGPDGGAPGPKRMPTPTPVPPDPR